MALGATRGDRQFVPVSEGRSDPRSLKALLAMGEAGLATVRQCIADGGPTRRIDDVILEPVIPDPSVIWCVGLNYRDHMEETGRSPTEKPTLFLRLPISQVGHKEALWAPRRGL